MVYLVRPEKNYKKEELKQWNIWIELQDSDEGGASEDRQKIFFEDFPDVITGSHI